MAMVVLPSHFVLAIGEGTNTTASSYVCVDSKNATQSISSTKVCPSGIIPIPLPSGLKTICVYYTKPQGSISEPVNGNGCYTESGAMYIGPIKVSSLPKYNPSSLPSSPNNPSSPTNNQTTPSTPTNGKPNTSPIAIPSGGKNSTTSTYSKGDCESGFHKLGPFCVPDNPFSSNNSNSLVRTTSISDIAKRIIDIALLFAGIIAVIMFIIGGYLYITARGNDAQVGKAVKTLSNAVIGLVIIVMSYALVQVVYNFIIGK